ncbi:hypothetical protein GGF31_002522 [Allomyces arbusculus]|nr:hypothetical protein GGF31_002522 [Allomyces arbusculus]
MNYLAVTMHQNYNTMFKGIFPNWHDGSLMQYLLLVLPKDLTDLLAIRALAAVIWTKHKKDHKEAYLLCMQHEYQVQKEEEKCMHKQQA